jgi:hypothetical protein
MVKSAGVGKSVLFVDLIVSTVDQSDQLDILELFQGGDFQAKLLNVLNRRPHLHLKGFLIYYTLFMNEHKPSSVHHVNLQLISWGPLSEVRDLFSTAHNNQFRRST